jgi:hypothetical protein
MNRAYLALLLLLICLLLAAVKYTTFPDLSWWWITAPLWGPPALAVLLSVCIFVYALLVTLNGKSHQTR